MPLNKKASPSKYDRHVHQIIIKFLCAVRPMSMASINVAQVMILIRKDAVIGITDDDNFVASEAHSVGLWKTVSVTAK